MRCISFWEYSGRLNGVQALYVSLSFYALKAVDPQFGDVSYSVG